MQKKGEAEEEEGSVEEVEEENEKIGDENEYVEETNPKIKNEFSIGEVISRGGNLELTSRKLTDKTYCLESFINQELNHCFRWQRSLTDGTDIVIPEKNEE